MGKSSRSKPTATARQRLAQQQAARRRRAQTRRRMLIAGGSVAVVVVIVVAFIVAKLVSPAATVQPARTDAQVARDVTTVPAAIYNAVGDGDAEAPTAVSGLPELKSDGKPEVLYMGGEYCPYCAAERWALAEALSRFGTLSGLGFIHSAPDDGDIATMTFLHARYTSTSIAFTPVEWFGEAAGDTPFGHVYLQHPTSAEVALFNKYGHGGIPFIDIGNRYVSSVQYSPEDLSGLTWVQIAAAMRDPSSQVAKDIDGAANQLAAAISSVIKSS
jgi:hypothetical protein